MIEDYTIREGTILQAKEIVNGIATVTVVSGKEFNVPLTSLVSVKELDEVIQKNMKLYMAQTQGYSQEFNSIKKLDLEIVKPLEKKLVVSKERELKLQVQVNCTKPLIYGWFKNGVLIDEKTEKMNTSFNNGVYELLIEQPNIDECNGVFSFAVKNLKDDSFKSCSSVVLVSGK